MERDMGIYTVNESFDKGMLAGSSCAFGVFDGLHVGHRYLIDSARETRQEGGKALAITFDIDPDEVFHPNRLKKLMRNADRLEALANAGVDDVIVLPFVESLYTLGPDEFLQRTFPLGAPAHLHVGEDFRFGSRAAGTVSDLEAWGDRVGCAVHVHPLVNAGGKPVTATRIRTLLLDCQLDEANRLLGHPYTLRETVHPGRGQGTGFGFATANLQVKPHDRVLGEGVYAAYATVADERYKAAVSVGVSPTFEATSTANMEVHILDFEGDLIGEAVAVEFVEYLRPMIKFDSTEALIAAVTADIEHVRAMP